MTQLRKDIAMAFEGAQDRVLAYAPGEDDLATVLMRWLDGSTRFLEPHPAITAARRAVHERAEAFVMLSALAPKADKNPGRMARTARTHLLSALSDMEATIYQYGRATAAADNVGIALAGQHL